MRHDESAKLARPAGLPVGRRRLVSTAADYHRFTQMLLRRGEFDGCRLLGPRTVALHDAQPPARATWISKPIGRPLFAETPFNGVGFGLGFSVRGTPDGQASCRVRRVRLGWGGEHRVLGRPGRGAVVMFFTQLMPSSTHPIRQHLRQLVYQALVA